MCLTQDTLEYIFTFLLLKDRQIVKQVCRRWNNASVLGAVQCLTIDNTVNKKYLKTVLSKNNIQYLKQIKIFIDDNDILLLVDTNCKNLTHFTFQLDNMFDGLEDLRSEIVNDILRNNNKLQYVNLKLFIIFVDITFKIISTYTKLKYILYKGYYTYFDRFKMLLNCKSSLEVLDIPFRASDEDFINISTNHPLLKHLGILNGITDITLGYISGCIMLQSIKLEQCSITDKGLNYIFTSCKLLKHIDISGSTKLTNEGFKNIGKNIKSIKLEKCNITDIGYITFRCTGLEYIELILCDNVKFNNMCRCEMLKNIYISYCKAITSNDLLLISTQAIILERFSISLCNVYKYGIKYIIDNCLKLKYIYIYGCRVRFRCFKKQCKKLNIKYVYPSGNDDAFM